jgi:adsorption protein B
MWLFDRLALELLAPLAVWVLASGLDDFVIDLSWLWLLLRSWLRPRHALIPAPPTEPRIAILVPCWQEDDVLEDMVTKNLQRIQYENYDIWLALYPNDSLSIAAAQKAQSRSDRIHWSAGERPGPTTKADNINQLLNNIFLDEKRTGRRYDIFLLHDAEDVVHPLELREAARLLQHYHMVQFPVLPLPMKPSKLTHGVYADEFAEFHRKDLQVRAAWGGFIPSAGVSTALHREVIELFRILRGAETLNPRCLTEDYFLGLEVNALGLRQAFSFERAPVTGEPIATRSYFPDTFKTAVRQRSRWIAGNMLQSWERYGWNVDPRQVYWLWRDRKGMINQLPNMMAFSLFLVGLLQWSSSVRNGTPWALAEAIAASPLLTALIWTNLGLVLWRLTFRIGLGWHFYGWRHAALAPVRIVWANIINFCASWRAFRSFATAKTQGKPLVWAKTAHSFPQETKAKAHSAGK